MRLLRLIKRLITRETRNKLVSMFWFVPDEAFLKINYRIRTGKKLDIDHPRTFNEKIQWLKLHDRRNNYRDLADKYMAKKIVGELIGENHIIPTYGVWDSFDQIKFDELPDAFVLKCTHDSGSVVICKNKADFDYHAAKRKIVESMKVDYYWISREWCYKDLPRRIIAEKFLDNADLLVDYKFFCFNGKPKFLYISKGLDNHNTACISFLDISWQLAPFQRNDYNRFDDIPPKPKCYNSMLQIAEVLSKGIPFARVDLYDYNDNVFFSELTLYPAGGMMKFQPDYYDEILGELIQIQSVKMNE